MRLTLLVFLSVLSTTAFSRAMSLEDLSGEYRLAHPKGAGCPETLTLDPLTSEKVSLKKDSYVRTLPLDTRPSKLGLSESGGQLTYKHATAQGQIECVYDSADSPAQKTQASEDRDLKKDLEKRITEELSWFTKKTPPTERFADKTLEQEYNLFLNDFGFGDTKERRDRFSVLEEKPFSIAEMTLLAEISKRMEAKVPADVPRESFGPNRPQRSGGKVQAQVPVPKPAAKVRRIRDSSGKPRYIPARYWITADIAIALRADGIEYNDVVTYFDRVGFRDLKTGKGLSSAAIEAKYATGMGYTDLTEEDIQLIRDFSTRAKGIRSKVLMDLIRQGYSIDELRTELIAKGFPEEELNEARNVARGPYAEAYEEGQVFKNLITEKSKSMPASLARLEAQLERGHISREAFDKSFAQEEAAVAKYRQEIEQTWGAFASNVFGNIVANIPTILYGSVAPTPVYVDTRQEYSKASVNNIVAQYGSVTNYNKHLADVEVKYRYRPLARPVEFATNFFKAIPNTIASVVQYGDVLREIVPLTPLDAYNRLKGKEFKATDGHLYQFGESVKTYVESLKPANEDFRGEFVVEVVPQVLGQLTVQIGAGVLTGGSTLLPTLIAVSSGGVEQYKQATKANASADHRKIAALVGSIVSITDAIPMAKYLKPLNQGQKLTFLEKYLGTVFNGLAKNADSTTSLLVTRALMAAQIKSGMLVQATQELTEKKINDFTANLTYDPQRNALMISEEDVTEFLGGAVGGRAGTSFSILLSSFNSQQTISIRDEVAKQVKAMLDAQKATPPQPSKLARTDANTQAEAKTTQRPGPQPQQKEQSPRQQTAPSTVETRQRISPEAQAELARQSELKKNIQNEAEEQAKAFLEVMEAGTVSGKFKMVVDPKEALAARLLMIQQAKDTIDISYYIFQDTDSSRILLNELRKALRRGVNVRFMVDGTGSVKAGTSFYSELQTLTQTKGGPRLDKNGKQVGTAKFEAVVINPVINIEARIRKFFAKVNYLITGKEIEIEHFSILQRSHDKILMVDIANPRDSMAIVGGRNISNNYFGIGKDKDHVYNDLDIVIKAPTGVSADAAPESQVLDGLSRHYNKLYAYTANRRFSDFLFKISRSTAAKNLNRIRNTVNDNVRSAEAELAPVLEKLAKEDYLNSNFDEGPVAFLNEYNNIIRRRPFAASKSLYGDNEESIMRNMWNQLKVAKKDILICSPYIYLTTEETAWLVNWLKEDPSRTLRILTNSTVTSDNLFAQSMVENFVMPKLIAKLDEAQVPRSQYELLAFGSMDNKALGGKEPQGKIHAKFWMVDNFGMGVGTSNFDPLSRLTNSEITANVFPVNGTASIQALNKYYDYLKERSTVWNSQEFEQVKFDRSNRIKLVIHRIVKLVLERTRLLPESPN